MIPHELLREQQVLSPKVDLSIYDGQWVALRDGHVVAHAPDPHSLRMSAKVNAYDALIPVSVVASQLIV